eukprot:2862167-Amphidinium_carterae.1
MTRAGSWVWRAPSGGGVGKTMQAAGALTQGPRACVSASQTHGAPCSSASSSELCAQDSPHRTQVSPTWKAEWAHSSCHTPPSVALRAAAA